MATLRHPQPIPPAAGSRGRRAALRTGIGRRLRPGLGRDLTLLFWGMILWNFGIGLYANLWSLYIASLDASPVLIGLLIGGQGIVRIALTLPSGIVADRASRRRLIVLTTLVGVPAALSYGAAQTWWHLLPGLLLMALANFSLPALSSYIADAVPARDRVRAFTLIYTVGPSAAFIVAPILGGWLADRLALRVVFFVAAAAFAGSTLVFARISERPRAETGEDQAGYREALRHPAVRWVSILEFAVLGAMTIGITLLPNYLQEVHDLTLGDIGRFGSIAAVGSILLSTLVGRSRHVTSTRGIALAMLGIGGVCAVTLATGNLWILSAAFLMRGGFMVAWTLFAATLGDVAPPHLRGRAYALAEFLGGTGFGLAPFAAGALYGWRSGAPLLLTALAAVPLALLTLWIERRFVRPAVAT